ncbi:uncharacterized protein LOC134673091 [Cydia fagiglandana]|uniref:uncharacterized protein LOC134673091 n=1 Tax=Cydia fagiglandana TaxID=1458189 RepID=UPI002FEE458A
MTKKTIYLNKQVWILPLICVLMKMKKRMYEEVYHIKKNLLTTSHLQTGNKSKGRDIIHHHNKGHHKAKARVGFHRGHHKGHHKAKARVGFHKGHLKGRHKAKGRAGIHKGRHKAKGRVGFRKRHNKGHHKAKGRVGFRKRHNKAKGKAGFLKGQHKDKSKYSQMKYVVHDYSSGSPLDYSENKADRNVFVRKVMLILLVMLMFTTAFMLVVILVIVLMVMSCVMPTASCARKSPSNYVCLVIVVILESLVTGAVTARYRTEIVLLAFIATLAVVALCVVLAYTKFDFTKWILYVIAISVTLSVLMLIVVIMMLVFHVRLKPLMLGLTFLMTLVNVVMFIIELQMVLGGKSVELDEEDYALGAFMLYTSIIQLFINILIMARMADS